MVLLLRALGHPARLVTGFLGGERNPVGGYRQVRQSDAHAWVEVLGPDGWVTFDPTPREEPGEGGLALVRQLLDYVRYRWYSGVVDYSLGDQRRAAAQAWRSLQDFGASLRRLPGDAERMARAAQVLVAAGIFVVGVWFLWPRIRWRTRVAGGDPALTFYAETLRLLARRGVARALGETPRELAARAAPVVDGAAGAVAALTDAFCDARYGTRPLDGARRAAVDAALVRLRACPGKPARSL